MDDFIHLALPRGFPCGSKAELSASRLFPTPHTEVGSRHLQDGLTVS